ncbi:calcium permeable stress-gated cation channel, partial [Phenoliferia sp. Uapishka_3]
MSPRHPSSQLTIPALLLALVLGLVVLGALLVVWFALHSRDMRLFQPRTILPPPGQRAPDLPNGPIGWFKGVVMAPDILVLEAQGPDAYFFLRFIRLGVFLFAFFFIVTWIILMPIAGTGSNGGIGLTRFTYGNIGENQQPRLVAYFLVAIILTLWVIYLIDVEYKHYRVIRQQWLSSEKRSGLPETRTVVIVNVPKTFMTVESIKELASESGIVQNVWISRKVDDLEEIYEDRNKEVGILEGKEGGMIAMAAKNVRKNKLPDPSKSATIEANDLVSQYIAKKKQPSHKRGFLGLFGKKVDTLNDSPAYIQEKDEALATGRASADSLPLGDTAFIRFATRRQAHAFVASVGSGKSSEKGLKQIKGEVEVMPENVYWANTLKSPTSRTIGGIIGWTLTIILIIIWAIPVALVGFISNINTLTTTVKFLSFLNSLPAVVLGIIQGVLPPVLLAVLFMLLPVVLRMFVRMGGPVLRSEIELQLFSRFWLFQVIHGFLIITLSAGLIDALKKINGQTLPQLPNLLATKLPAASTFFLQYLALCSYSFYAGRKPSLPSLFQLDALTSFGLSVSRTVPFVMSKLGGILSGPTPRKEWKFQDKMLSIALGTTWPPIALLMCVGIVYSTIQPIICLFGLATFSLLYVMYKYVLIWVADQPDSLETGGEFMRKGIMTIFVSLYVELIFLAALFFLATNSSGKRSKPGLAGGVIMIVLIIVVIAFHWMTTHKRQNQRECHFLEGTLHPNSSKTVIHENGEHNGTPEGTPSMGYPPQNKEGKESGLNFGNSIGSHDRAFDHPALWRDAPVVWIADDSLGIAKKEAARLNELKVPASTEFATMDAEGKINVTRCAPDEVWLDGINLI